MVTRHETISRLCYALSRLHDTTAHEWSEPCDCFCRNMSEADFEELRFRSSGEALGMLELMVAAYCGVVFMAMTIKARQESQG